MDEKSCLRIFRYLIPRFEQAAQHYPGLRYVELNCKPKAGRDVISKFNNQENKRNVPSALTDLTSLVICKVVVEDAHILRSISANRDSKEGWNYCAVYGRPPASKGLDLLDELSSAAYFAFMSGCDRETPDPGNVLGRLAGWLLAMFFHGLDAKEAFPEAMERTLDLTIKNGLLRSIGFRGAIDLHKRCDQLAATYMSGRGSSVESVIGCIREHEWTVRILFTDVFMASAFVLTQYVEGNWSLRSRKSNHLKRKALSRGRTPVYDPADDFALVQAWKDSGLTQAIFAREKGIPVKSLRLANDRVRKRTD